MKALEFMHARFVVHSDVKPQNIAASTQKDLRCSEAVLQIHLNPQWDTGGIGSGVQEAKLDVRKHLLGSVSSRHVLFLPPRISPPSP